jgi:hypothetical protein
MLRLVCLGVVSIRDIAVVNNVEAVVLTNTVREQLAVATVAPPW